MRKQQWLGLLRGLPAASDFRLWGLPAACKSGPIEPLKEPFTRNRILIIKGCFLMFCRGVVIAGMSWAVGGLGMIFHITLPILTSRLAESFGWGESFSAGSCS